MTHTSSVRHKIAAVSAAFALAAGAGVAMLVVPSSAQPIGSPDALKRSALGANLIDNPGFGNGLSSWSRGSGVKLTSGGVWSSRRSAVLDPRKRVASTISDERATAPQSEAGRRYEASVFVRATDRPVSGHFGLAEWSGSTLVARNGQSFVAKVDRWSRVTFVATAERTGDDLVLSLSAERLGGSNALKVDRVRLHPVKGPKSSPAPQPSSSTTAPAPDPSTTSPEPSPSQSSTPPTQNTADTLFGASVEQGSRTWTQALADSNAAYGGMEVVRVFYPGLPSAWPGRTAEVGGPVVVSFKALPSDILAGKDDTYLTSWFRNAPTDRDIWWTYWHEPEDDIARGAFTAQQYRDAYRHIAELAAAAHNPSLHNTLILMCWTLNPASGRTFTNYFPGKDVVEVLGWDCYSVSTSTVPYAKPSDMYGRAVAISRDLGMPFGIAETGSLLASADPDGTKRGDWLRSIGHYLEDQGAVFACYFDSTVGGEFRLLDAPSRQGWHDVVSTIGSHDPL